MAIGTGIGEFFVSLTVDAAGGGLVVSDLVQNFGALEIATLAEIGLLWEMAVRMAAIVDEGVKMSLGLEQFTMHTGISAQELQKWQIVAAQSHATAEDVTQSMENVTKGLRQIALGENTPLLKALQFLGIEAQDASGKLKDADQLMGEIRHRLGVVTKDAGMQELILGWAGINANLRETLLLSDDAFKSRSGTAHGMTKGQEDAFDAARDKMVAIGLVAKDITTDIGAWLVKTDGFVSSLTAVLETMRAVRKFMEGGEAPKPNPNDPFAGPWLKNWWDSIPSKAQSQEQQRQQLADWFNGLIGNSQPQGRLLEPAMAGAVGGGREPVSVHIDKHDTYIIQEAHDPNKVKEVIEKHWDETLGKKTLDGFDQQHGNGGY